MTSVILYVRAVCERTQGGNAAKDSEGGGAAVPRTRVRRRGRGRDYGGSGADGRRFLRALPFQARALRRSIGDGADDGEGNADGDGDEKRRVR